MRILLSGLLLFPLFAAAGHAEIMTSYTVSFVGVVDHVGDYGLEIGDTISGYLSFRTTATGPGAVHLQALPDQCWTPYTCSMSGISWDFVAGEIRLPDRTFSLINGDASSVDLLNGDLAGFTATTNGVTLARWTAGHVGEWQVSLTHGNDATGGRLTSVIFLPSPEPGGLAFAGLGIMAALAYGLLSRQRKPQTTSRRIRS